MFFGRMRRTVELLLSVFCAAAVLSACVLPKGSILIIENAKGFAAELKAFSSFQKCDLVLESGCEVQVETGREEGVFSLVVQGKRGSQPYTGNNLQTGVFTFTVSEADTYVFIISGNNATGKIIIKNLGKG